LPIFNWWIEDAGYPYHPGIRFPLKLSNVLSHSLDDRDIQSYTVKKREFHLIVGYDPLLDLEVYQKYEHWKFIQLWIPLFPVPYTWMEEKPGHHIGDMLTWEIL